MVRFNLRDQIEHELGASKMLDHRGRPLRADVALRRARAFRDIRRYARIQTLEALVHLDQHVEAIYVDLGLDRPHGSGDLMVMERHNADDKVDAITQAIAHLTRPQEDPNP